LNAELRRAFFRSDVPSLEDDRSCLNLCGSSALVALQRENPDQAVEWRKATRHAFSEALATGSIVEDFFRRPDGAHSVGVYLLSRARSIEDFV